MLAKTYQWFSNISIHQNHLKIIRKQGSLGQWSELPFQWDQSKLKDLLSRRFPGNADVAGPGTTL